MSAIRWTAERVAAALAADAARRGRSPTLHEWALATRSRPQVKMVIARFGTWNRALAAAGLEPRPRSQTLGRARRAAGRVRTRCARGHELPAGESRCARCRAESRRRYQQARKRRLLLAGACTTCGGRRDDPSFFTCSACRARSAAAKRRR